jgi:magnesium-transporting ATPase (P-type)
MDGMPDDRASVERELSFIGVVTMIDPPRAEVAAAVDQCRAAGVRIVMVTGDHALTARAIAEQVGIVHGRSPVVSGDELDAMPEPELDDLLGRSQELVFARTSPEAKLRIAEAARATGNAPISASPWAEPAPMWPGRPPPSC